MNLIYPNDSKWDIIGYVYACYLSNSHNVTMVNHKPNICSHMVVQRFHDNLWNKP